MGVGCGRAARMFVAELMKHGAAYFASDISDDMTKTFVQRFNESALAQDPRIKI